MKSYQYIDGEFEYKLEIKHSIFIASIKGEVRDENDAIDYVKSIKKKYSDATHNCFAYISDENGMVSKFSDDGEPSGTAGQPILEVLKKQKLFKTAVVVTRYFGGIKLGASGLLGAYTNTVVGVIKKSIVNKKIECKIACLNIDYPSYSLMSNFLKNNEFEIISTNFENDVSLKIAVPLDNCDSFVKKINELFGGNKVVNFKEDIIFCSIKKL